MTNPGLPVNATPVASPEPPICTGSINVSRPRLLDLARMRILAVSPIDENRTVSGTAERVTTPLSADAPKLIVAEMLSAVALATYAPDDEPRIQMPVALPVASVRLVSLTKLELVPDQWMS